MTPSHRLKLKRANKHLQDLQVITGDLRRRREYPVIESMERQGQNNWEWVYRLDLAHVQPTEVFPIVLGDFLFNVRSALDHLVVGIAPRKRKGQASFPIFTADPFETDASGAYLDTDAVGRWDWATRGLPDNCVTALRVLQPHEAASGSVGTPRDHPLAILNALQNADKHRNLVGVISGLERAEVTIVGQEAFCALPVLKHRAVIAREPAKVKMRIEGDAVVGIGGANKVRSFDLFTGNLLRFVENEVFPRLEPFLG